MDIIQFEGNGYKVEVARRISDSFIRDKVVIVQSNDDDFNRKVVSSKNVDILLDPHLGYRKDKLHQRDSGLNQVLCELAKENNVAIGFSFSSVLNSTRRSEVIGRMIQNIILCRKYKVKMVIGTFAVSEKDVRNLKDVQAFFRALGMTGKEVQMNFVSERLDWKKRYISKGVMLSR